MEGPLGRYTEGASRREPGLGPASPLLDLLLVGFAALGRRAQAMHDDEDHRLRRH
ncbi:hypothetical protein [Arthrobacter sp. NEB 688]|uniref:hypothetical protein n=1 Tax=Arthrobacter sp. NEB 688 TaxID=904039 RepID=UPI001564C6F9|nr:hypothetical protein [Arthrobacter sp. NEB 688]QKE84372.1 hypothetical protein HL663_10790 [Arthrobacter sp. NEB 688]